MLAAVLGVVSLSASAAEVVKNDTFTLNVDGRLQVLGAGQYLDDPIRYDLRAFVFMKQARLGASGKFGEVDYRTLLAFGGEDAPAGTNATLGLLDMYVDFPIGPVRLRAGQFKVPYSRERLADSGNFLFNERSVQNVGFRWGRDVGLAIHSGPSNLAAGLGVFVGGGRNVPERYLPQKLGFPLVVGRLGYSSEPTEDIFMTAPEHPSKRVSPSGGLRYGVFVNGLYSKDSQVGHSTVFGVRQGEKSLLINSNWNPYLATTPTDRGQIWQAGADAYLAMPLGSGMARFEIEGNYAEYGNEYGSLNLSGGRAQVSYEREKFRAGLRYALLKPDHDLRSPAGRTVVGGKLINEVTPSMTVFLNSAVRLVADVPVQIGAPLVMERVPAVGAYVLTEQPDQAAYVKEGNTTERQNVVGGRVMLQASF